MPGSMRPARRFSHSVRDFRLAGTNRNLHLINHKCSLFVRLKLRIGYKGGMNEILFMIGDMPVRAGAALIGLAWLALLLLLGIAIAGARSGRRGAEFAMAQAARADDLEARLGDMQRAQSEATGRVDAMGQHLAGSQAE